MLTHQIMTMSYPKTIYSLSHYESIPVIKPITSHASTQTAKPNILQLIQYVAAKSDKTWHETEENKKEKTEKENDAS